MSQNNGESSLQVGIMQPYFLPHFSYFQLIANTEYFCLHDQVKYTKQSWINRNRIIVSGKIDYITIPVQSSSDLDLIGNKAISATFDKSALLRKIELNYKKSPHFREVFPIISEILNCNNINLFEFLENSITKVCQYLELDTKIVRSSDTGYNQNLSKSKMVIDICKKLEADVYINSEGGIELYEVEEFLENGIFLRFAKQMKLSYVNSLGETNTSLSMLDTLMWVDKSLIMEKLYEIAYVRAE
jgi:hypothetical protein